MFRDRQHAGEVLAGHLATYSNRPRTLLLALPRGGVPVAAAMARRLLLPLDVFTVRKIGAPSQPEFAIGAVTPGAVVLNQHAIDALGISQEELEPAIARERAELARREQTYREDRPPLDLTGQTVILVDDGLATGYTMLAAIRAVRQQQPLHVAVAVPVAPPEAVNMLSREADQVFCAGVPRMLVAVGQFYDDFSQTTDDEVRAALHETETCEKLRAQSKPS